MVRARVLVELVENLSEKRHVTYARSNFPKKCDFDK